MTLTTSSKKKRSQVQRRAGRPRLNKMRRQIKLSPEIDAYLRALGGGKLSQGIEKAALMSQLVSVPSSQAARLERLEELGFLSQRATTAPSQTPLPAYRVSGQAVSEMLSQERR